MQLIYNMIQTSLPDTSRVWVYQSNRFFSKEEKSFIENQLSEFIKGWNNHGTNLTADAFVVDPSFIVLAVNEADINASGCSIDSSVRFVKQIGQELNVDFFNRLKLLVEKEGEQKYVSIHSLSEVQDWNIYNTLVQTLGDFKKSFLIPVSSSPLLQLN
jgi:hypothetical protein